MDDGAFRGAHESGADIFGGARGEELAEAASSSRAADASVARALGRPGPSTGGPSVGYLADLAGRERLSAAQERDLVVAAKAGDRQARAALVEAFMPSIGSVARLYRETVRVERIELFQEGVVGLLRALERYDPARGTPFWAFAAWWVRQAKGPALAGEEEVGTLGDLIADPLAEGEYERVLEAIQAEGLLALLAGLSERERNVLRGRFGLQGSDQQSRREIAEALGVSAERVRQLEQRALGKLAAAAGGRP